MTNRTISQIMEFLQDESTRPSRNLRAFLDEKIADLTERWYKAGFQRGHKESYKVFKDTGTLPKRLRYKGQREFFKGQKRKVRVTSRIKARDAWPRGARVVRSQVPVSRLNVESQRRTGFPARRDRPTR